MKQYVAIIAAASFIAGCSGHHGENQFDTNPAEATNLPGDLTRGNSETNEEAAARGNHGVTPNTTEKHPSLTALADSRMNLTQAFASKVTEASLTEIRLGELASTKSTNQSVKEFAEMMIKDHTAASEELKALAKEKEMTVPFECQGCDVAYEDLNALATTDFDMSYVDKMIADHEEAVKVFKNESENGTDPEMKEWATEKLPIIEHHLYMANELKLKMNARSTPALTSKKKPAAQSNPVALPTEEPTEPTTTTVVVEETKPLTKKELKKQKREERKEKKKTGE